MYVDIIKMSIYYNKSLKPYFIIGYNDYAIYKIVLY